MTTETALLWSWINVLTKKRYDALLERFGDLEKPLSELSVEFLRELGVREDAALKAMNRMEEFDADTYRKEIEQRSVRLLTIEDDDYPASLAQIPDAPVFLYLKGDLDILSQPCISIVGSRDMSDYGRRVVQRIVPPLISAHVVTVSGLAYGIDAEVARETLHAGGRTVAVLGQGLSTIYPKANEKLAAEIVAKGGLLLSEFPLDQAADKYTFPARNRIIAGLSLCTVVAEAAEDSGSLITAELALEYNRDVCAVPGDIDRPLAKGCHMLIARGHARLVTSGEEILKEIGIAAPTSSAAASCFTADSPDEQSVYDSLSSLPAALDDLVVKTALDAAALNAVLTILELKGAVRNVGGGRWVRS